MAVNATTGIVNSTNLVNGAIESVSSDKDMFLKLLISQLQNQDPLNPQDDKEFLSQMAQFTTLEQMQNLNSSFVQQQAYSTIGKFVVGSYVAEDGTTTRVEGRVEGVTMVAGEAYLTVGEQTIQLSKVSEIYEDYTIINSITDLINSGNMNIGSILNNEQALGLVGKTVQAITTDDDGNAVSFIEGKVTSIKYADGSPILIVNGKEVYPSEVFSIATEDIILGSNIKVATEDEEGNISYSQGTINSITFEDNAAFVNLSDGTKVPVSKINHITEANQSINLQVSNGTITGIAEAVVLKDGEVYLQVGDELLLYTDVRDN